MSKKKRGCLHARLFIMVVYNVLRVIINVFTNTAGVQNYDYLQAACEEYFLEDSLTMVAVAQPLRPEKINR